MKGTRAGIGERPARVNRGATGRSGEDATLRWYTERGYRLIARNWRCPLGEIDLVLGRGGLVVFCEVKTRLGSAFGGGFEAVGHRKQRKLRQLAEVFLLTTRVEPVRARFDVASVLAEAGRAARVEVFEDAF
jgi:putative endonuclease